MTYSADGVRRVYNFNNKQIFLTKSDDEVYMRGGYVIHLGRSLVMYDNLGTRQSSSKNAILAELTKIRSKDRANYLKKNPKKYYRMPTSRSYSE